MNSHRQLNFADQVILNLDLGLRTLIGRPRITERTNPGSSVAEAELSEKERDHSARLMRINHTGEVCAQALYQGQALTAKTQRVQQAMQRAADEENDHLEWCEHRVKELGGRLSLLNPAWYAGSLALGAAAGIAGDKWSLGFVSETERQVEGHLDDHLADIAPEDLRSRAILEQMKEDEARHGQKARDLGGMELPPPIQQAMRWMSKLMTKSVYYW